MSNIRGKNRGIFDDFSVVSVAASALTAATSFLLSSKIGLAGSLIGAVIAAIISAVATQVYKGILEASAERIRDAAALDDYAPMGTRYAPSHSSTVHGHSIVSKLVMFAVGMGLAAVVVVSMTIGLATHGKGIGPTSFAPQTEQIAAEEENLQDQGEQVASSQDDGQVQPEGQETASQLSSDAPHGQQEAATGSTDVPASEGQNSSSEIQGDAQGVPSASDTEVSQ